MLSQDEKNSKYDDKSSSMSIYRQPRSRKGKIINKINNIGGKRQKKKYLNIADTNENQLFSKVQEALRDYLNIMVNIDYIKVIIVGLKDMIEMELNSHKELQQSLNFNVVV